MYLFIKLGLNKNENPTFFHLFKNTKVKGVKKNQTAHSFLYNFFVFDSSCMKIRQNMYE